MAQSDIIIITKTKMVSLVCLQNIKGKTNMTKHTKEVYYNLIFNST